MYYQFIHTTVTMSTAGFKRVLTQWYRNSYFHDASVPCQANPEFDKFNVAASLPETNEKFSFSDLYLPMAPYFSVVQRSSKLLGFTLLRLLIMLIFAIYHIFDGTHWRVYKSRHQDNYAQSARVFNILGRHRYDTLVNLNKASDFILRHTGFDHPHRVLSDEASLYEVNKYQAVFIETSPGVEVWRGRYNSFHAISQLEHAVRVIIMPIESFYRMSAELGDPKGKLVFITNTARCGSTLMSRIYEQSDEFVSLSEPTGINYLRNFVGRENEPWVQHHARAIVRMLCKPTHVENFAIKITPNSTKILPLLKRLYPDASYVFIYRDAMPVCKSMYKIWKNLPMGRLNLIFARFALRFYLPTLNFTGYYDPVDSKHNLRLTPGYGQGVFLWANVIGMYRRFRKSGIDMAAVKYEDLVKDKESALTRLFMYNGIPARCIKPALRAFNCDSQANSILSMDVLRNTRLPPFTEHDRNEINKICAFYNLPKVGDSCVLEGTLTREQITCPHRL